jgi:predicted ferric reductase
MKVMDQIAVKSPAGEGTVGAAPALPLFWVALGGASLGALLLIALSASIAGINNPWWYLSRSSAFVGYVLLWASMALGISITNKLARVWPGGPAAFDLHQYFSWLGLGFTVVHVVTLLGDEYIGNTGAQWLIPFASANYEPLWVGIGQVAFYLLVPVTLSFYARKRLGTRTWRTIHGISYAVFVLGLFHAVFSGTDSPTIWAGTLYWGTGVSVFALTVYRLIVTGMKGRKNAASGLIR